MAGDYEFTVIASDIDGSDNRTSVTGTKLARS